ncbi:4'-phosphopantetheinyl transferase [Nocardiopsis terrae]|uniref:4'-phosphopantetheinyl transferase n=1 Tax=Nocardiopsis terrae TaxID=372655 RepID=A0ABR9HFF5_9ACTN|nr:4'-phosphopantetheinyl transferase superfamily protein [Nocardiopsis terrae]MBE1457758.1 4'-phosphopantetheinyl transferase [Nocardiopsis terrae]GHC84440.1 4'-phosphopantetheinyl transferase [Nocardiopsis terrae]
MTLSSAPLESSVWWAHTSAANERLLRLLDGGELARHSRFRLQADRDRYLLGRSMARLVLAERAGCAPEKVTFELRCASCEEKSRAGAGGGDDAPHGKPVPTGAAGGWEISVSHSGEWVALALARGVALGVDVERVSDTRDLAGLAGYTLADTEHEVWSALPEADRAGAFFGYWARKEALLKATGLGLSGGLRRVGVTPPHTRARLLFWEGGADPGAAWLSDLDRGPEYRSALAVLTDRRVELTVHPPEAAPALLRR